MDAPLKMLVLRLMAACPQYIRNILYTNSILVRPGVEEGRENIVTPLHRIVVLNARHDCGHPSSKMKGSKEYQRFEMGSVQRDIKQNSTFQHRKKKSLWFIK